MALNWSIDNLILTDLLIHNNPLSFPPGITTEDSSEPTKDNERMKTYIGDLNKGSQHADSINLMVVGHGGAGKTTLKNRVLLQESNFSIG